MPNVEPLREGDPAAVGPYRLVGRLGAGGHGVVYLGQARNGSPVAVKLLREDLAVDDRLAAAVAAARKVEPFCLARVLDASTSGRPYIVSEYVDGPSLQQAGRRGGAELQRLAAATATALDAIHQAGVVHGDLTPSNVLLGPDGAKIVDFGFAAVLGSGMKATSNIVGTPAYMAPEQLAGRPVGAAADVFSWASVIVFAATGVPPFGDDALPAVINRILHDEPELGELEPPLRDVVTACLAKDPGARPSMRDVLRKLTAPSRSTLAPHAAPDAYDTPDRQNVPPLPRRRPAEATTRDLGPSAQDAPSGRPGAAQAGEARDVQAHGSGHPGEERRGPEQGGHDVSAQNGRTAASLQALFDLSSPVEPPAGTRDRRGGAVPLGAPVAFDAPPAGPRPARGHAGPDGSGGRAGARGFEPASPRPGSGDRAGGQGAAAGGSGSAAAHGRPGFADAASGRGPTSGGPTSGGPTSGGPTSGGPASGGPASGGFGATPGGFAGAPGATGSLIAAVGQGTAGGQAGGKTANGQDSDQGTGDGAGGHEQPAPRPSRRRRVKTLAIAAVSGVSVCVLAAAIIWLTPTEPTPKTGNVPATGNVPTTPAATRPATAPAEPPSSSEDSADAGAQRSTADPAVTASTLPADDRKTQPASNSANRLSLVYVRAGGTRSGDCWSGGQVTLQALVRRSGAATSFTYTWLVDGTAIGRSSALISANGERYIAAPRTLRSTGGVHRVTLRITAPVAVERTVSVPMCEQGTS
ncbi:serine/threonine protein kinase [Nonomuraea sp. NPDC049309]|uniref:serine/threonine protein kinase n=1 Tax=Nonomuraea sp. NPDC049309 TaxID=3364350 RepID=UPI003718A070